LAAGVLVVGTIASPVVVVVGMEEEGVEEAITMGEVVVEATTTSLTGGASCCNWLKMTLN
jgi:hypothetical protein